MDNGGDDAAPIHVLPPEMLSAILILVPRQLDAVLACVCRRWRAAVWALPAEPGVDRPDSESQALLAVRCWSAYRNVPKLMDWAERTEGARHDRAAENGYWTPLARKVWASFVMTWASLRHGVYSEPYERSIRVMRQLRNDGRAPPKLRRAAIRGGHVEMLERIYGGGGATETRLVDVDLCVECGSLATFRWVVAHIRWRTRIGRVMAIRAMRNYAVERGRMDILEHMWTGGAPRICVPVQPAELGMYVKRAILNDNMTMADWLFDKEGGEVWAELYRLSLAFADGRRGLLEKAMPPDRPFVPVIPAAYLQESWMCYAVAARRGDVEGMEWLHDRLNVVMTAELAAEMAERGDTDTLVWLAQHRCQFDAQAPLRAAAYGQTAALEWLLDRGCPWHEVRCAQAAHRRGHSETLALIHARGELGPVAMFAPPSRVPRILVFLDDPERGAYCTCFDSGDGRWKRKYIRKE